jgi:hypothetical protein
MHETRLKIGKLKQTSLAKFEATSQLRELQLRRSLLTHNNRLYGEQLRAATARIDALREFCTRSQLKAALSAHRLAAQREAFASDKGRLQTAEQAAEAQLQALQTEQQKLGRRQAQMVSI